MTLQRSGRAALVLVLVVFAAIVAWLIAQDMPVEWDEAVYAGRARAWVSDLPATGWGDHRPPGVPLLAIPLVWVTTELPAIRLLGLASGLALLGACAWLAWTLRGPLAGALAALALSTVVPVVARSSQVLTDVAAGAGVVATAALLWSQLGRDRVAQRWLWLAPVAAGATFFLRYGSLPFLLALVGVAVVAWWRPLVASPRRAGLAAAAGVALALPHLIHATVVTGDPLGIVRLAGSLAPQATFGQAVSGYLADPGAFGIVAVAGTAAGVVALVAALVIDRPETLGLSRGAAALLLVPALAGTGAVAASSAPLPRLLIPAFALVLTGLAVVVARAFEAGRSGAVVGGVAAALLLLGMAGAAGRARADLDEATRIRAPVAAAARALATDAGGRTCGVLAREVPILTWYSGCAAQHFGFPPEAGRAARLVGEVRYLVLHSSQRGEPQGDDRAAYLRLVESPP
ncbi:MAG TPA: hypothetical protein VGA69_06825, partial [Nitriliruptorales bacterium]